MSSFGLIEENMELSHIRLAANYRNLEKPSHKGLESTWFESKPSLKIGSVNKAFLF
jgi:hypothetical protein